MSWNVLVDVLVGYDTFNGLYIYIGGILSMARADRIAFRSADIDPDIARTLSAIY